MNAALQALSNWWDLLPLHLTCPPRIASPTSLTFPLFRFLRRSSPIAARTFDTLLYRSRVLFLVFTFVKKMICVHWESDSWAKIAAVRHLRRQKQPFVIPCRVSCYKWTPTLSRSPLFLSLLCSFLSPHCLFMSPFTVSFVLFIELPFALVHSSELHPLVRPLESDRDHIITYFFTALCVLFFIPSSLYYYLPRGWCVFKLNSWCLLLKRVQIGEDVGQNLQSKSHSKNRSNWVTQLLKEGPLSETSLWCLFVWALPLFVTIGSLFIFKDFSPARGRKQTPCLIRSVVCPSLARFLSSP